MLIKPYLLNLKHLIDGLLKILALKLTGSTTTRWTMSLKKLDENKKHFIYNCISIATVAVILASHM